MSLVALPTRTDQNFDMTTAEYKNIEATLFVCGIEADAYDWFEYAYCMNCETTAVQLVSTLTGQHAAKSYLVTCTNCEDEAATSNPVM